MSTDLLIFHPNSCGKREDFQKSMDIISKLSVINNVAERGVNGTLTKDENEKQYLLQVVSDYEISYPNSMKDTLINK